MNLCGAQWLAYALPCRRFAAALTDVHARLRVDVGRYSFIVSDSHRLLIAGLPAHCERFWTLPSLVARRHGVAPNHLCTWRRLVAQGTLTAPASGEEVVPASF